ncbi:MAG: beta-lactamase [Peptococcaceae bacterium BRH_c8a]|nr:MAG: beta-lactamase [Peptococcaceae bacterium BRH_c8a]
MIFEGFGVGPIEANCYIIGDEQTKEAVVVDPGAEGNRILSRLEKKGLQCKYIILTHGHMDHVGALNEVGEATGAQVMIHKADAGMLTSPSQNLSAFMGAKLKFKEADKLLEDGDKIQLGSITIEVLHTPGHTLGGICLKLDDKNIITGDTLFAGSVGRSDFPGGSHEQLINSIKTKLMTYPDDTTVYPGHGPSSTIGSEKKHNPFL